MSTEKVTLNIGYVVSIAAFFFTFSGGLWHLGYWSTFKFNYFEYANLTDLFKTSFYLFFDRVWIMLALILMPLGFSLFAKYTIPTNVKINDEVLQRRKDKIRKIESFIAEIIIALSLSISFFFIIFSRQEVRFDIIPVLLSISSIIYLFRNNYLKILIPNEDARILLILLLTVYPTFNFFLGKKTGMDIYNRKRASIVTFVKTNDLLLNISLHGLPYLGSSSEYHFFFNGPLGVQIVEKKVIEYFSVSKESMSDDYFKSLPNYNDLINNLSNEIVELDTNRVYFDPILKLNIDSSFRRLVKENLFQK